jgi:hypothetical protein
MFSHHVNQALTKYAQGNRLPAELIYRIAGNFDEQTEVQEFLKDTKMVDKLFKAMTSFMPPIDSDSGRAPHVFTGPIASIGIISTLIGKYCEFEEWCQSMVYTLLDDPGRQDALNQQRYYSTTWNDLMRGVGYIENAGIPWGYDDVYRVLYKDIIETMTRRIKNNGQTKYHRHLIPMDFLKEQTRIGIKLWDLFITNKEVLSLSEHYNVLVGLGMQDSGLEHGIDFMNRHDFLHRGMLLRAEDVDLINEHNAKNPMEGIRHYIIDRFMFDSPETLLKLKDYNLADIGLSATTIAKFTPETFDEYLTRVSRIRYYILKKMDSIPLDLFSKHLNKFLQDSANLKYLSDKFTLKEVLQILE